MSLPDPNRGMIACSIVYTIIQDTCTVSCILEDNTCTCLCSNAYIYYFVLGQASCEGACVGWYQPAWANKPTQFRRKNGRSHVCRHFAKINDMYPDSHRLMKDNDPKHTSHLANDYFRDNDINWWKTPLESPDCNPIENPWHEMKVYLRREMKLKVKQELKDGIQEFWPTVNIPKCTKYICQLRKVIPE